MRSRRAITTRGMTRRLWHFGNDPVLGIARASACMERADASPRTTRRGCATITVHRYQRRLLGISRLSWSLSSKPPAARCSQPATRGPQTWFTNVSSRSSRRADPARRNHVAGNLTRSAAMLIVHDRARVGDRAADQTARPGAPLVMPWKWPSRRHLIPLTAVFGALGTFARGPSDGTFAPTARRRQRLGNPVDWSWGWPVSSPKAPGHRPAQVVQDRAPQLPRHEFEAVDYRTAPRARSSGGISASAHATGRKVIAPPRRSVAIRLSSC